MEEKIKEDCEKLLVHIKKCKRAMDMDGYTDAGGNRIYYKIAVQENS